MATQTNNQLADALANVQTSSTANNVEIGSGYDLVSSRTDSELQDIANDLLSNIELSDTLKNDKESTQSVITALATSQTDNDFITDCEQIALDIANFYIPSFSTAKSWDKETGKQLDKALNVFRSNIKRALIAKHDDINADFNSEFKDIVPSIEKLKTGEKGANFISIEFEIVDKASTKLIQKTLLKQIGDMLKDHSIDDITVDWDDFRSLVEPTLSQYNNAIVIEADEKAAKAAAKLEERKRKDRLRKAAKRAERNAKNDNMLKAIKALNSIH